MPEQEEESYTLTPLGRIVAEILATVPGISVDEALARAKIALETEENDDL